jgi:hypothetical protein
MAGLNININTLAENTARLGERISENLSERTRELAFTKGPGYLDTSETKIHDVRRQLEGNSDREKLDALKTLIAVSLVSKYAQNAHHARLTSLVSICLFIAYIKRSQRLGLFSVRR